jgi:hypothetical protein
MTRDYLSIAERYINSIDSSKCWDELPPSIFFLNDQKVFMGYFGWDSNPERFVVLNAAGIFIKEMKIEFYMIIHEGWMLKLKKPEQSHDYKYGDATNHPERIETLCFVAKDLLKKKTINRIWKIKEGREIISFEKAYPELDKQPIENSGDLSSLENFLNPVIGMMEAAKVLRIEDVSTEFQ